MIGVVLGAALVVGGLSQLSSEPNPRTQFHAECTDRELVIFHFDMKSAKKSWFEGLEVAKIAPEWHPGHAGCSIWLSGVIFRAGDSISIGFHRFS